MPTPTGSPLASRILKEHTLYRGRAYDFVELTLLDPKGVERPRPIVRHRGAVVILPILETSTGPEIVFVRNERHTINGWLEELPAGGLEVGEDPLLAAGRELREETGYQAATISPLGRFYTTPGVTDELMHAYVATGLTFVGQELEDYEVLTTHRRSVADALAAARSGQLLDGKSLLALSMARDKGLLPA